MTQIVLVLEENPEIQLVIAASLKDSDISVTQESNPDLFVEQARNLSPDLIFLSNSDSEQDYKNCREMREEKNLTKTPIILLANAKDEIDDGIISELGINGLLRKPFEASMLQEQLSPFITLDENYGTGPDKGDEEFMVDMGSIDNQLKEIRDGIQPSNTTGEEDAQVIDGFEQNTYESGFASLPASEMDSMILGDFWVDRNQPEKSLANEELAQVEIEKAVDVVEEITEDEVVVDVLEENAEDEIGMEDGFEFDLKLDEDEVENDSETTATETVSDETTSAPDGLEQLKNSGLEDKFAENRLAESQPAVTISKDQVVEPEQNLRGGLTEIDLEINDFEDLDEIWSRPPDLDQTLREGLTDISLDQADFQPEFPKNLSIFEAPAELPAEDINVGEDPADSLPDMDYFELKQDTADETLEEESSLDNLMLTDSEELFTDEVEDVEQFVLETSANEFEEMLDLNPEDAENPEHGIFQQFNNTETEALSWLDLNKEISFIIEIMAYSSLMIGAVLFLLASLGVINSIFMSIYERIYEFGVIKAIGTRPSEIVRLILWEALLLALISCVIGMLLGFAVGSWTAANGIGLGEVEFSGIAMGNNIFGEFHISQFTTFPFFAVLLTLAAALYPARFAAKIVPSEALQRSL